MAESTDGLRARRKEFESYASAKVNEIDEQRLSWRYYHSLQYTDKQLKALAARNQPPIVFDRISRKIDGLVGTIRRLRSDPKAFPRTMKQDQGADIATQVIRTICDQSNFEDVETECYRDAAVHGIGVSELTSIEGDHGDPDFKAEHIDPRTFFYDPRSMRGDFADARFMGSYKLVGLDEIEEIMPGSAEKVRGAGDGSFETAFDDDRGLNWVDEKDRVRLVDHWYIEGGVWKWCLHVGTVELASGESPFYNHLRRSICKFFAFSNQVDQDGTRYGFIRRLKGPQDAMNQHRSKAMHIMNTRQIKARRGTIDVAQIRREAVKPDGVLEYDGDSADFEVIQPAQEFLQQTQYYQDAKGEIEGFGPNQALLGDLGQSASGRAYAMAQQAGLAEIGPFLKNGRHWKLSQWQAFWCAAQRYWTSDRFIRVTDNEEVANLLQINKLEMDQFGQPMLVNALGAIDVDIVISEGPDTENVQGDVYDILASLAQSKIPVPPAALIEVSNLPSDQKKKIIGLLTQPDPVADQAKQLDLAGKAAENEETQSRAMLNVSKARSEGLPDQPQQAREFELPPDIQIAQAVAEIDETNASVAQKRAQANKTQTDAMLAPRQMAIESAHRNADRQHTRLPA